MHLLDSVAVLRPLSVCALWLASATATLAASATPDTYDLQPLASATVAADMQRCVGAPVLADQLQAFLARAWADGAEADPLRGAQLALEQGRGVVLVAAGQWACVPLSTEGFPLWPVEALHGLIVPVGAPARLTRAWRQNLLAQVARDGVGRGLIVYPGGEADQVHLIAEQRQALQVKFTVRLLPAGSYKRPQYPAVLHHPGLTRLVTRSSSAGAGTPWRMAIPPHRLLKPVRDEYAVVEPTLQTRQFNFEGTQWWLGRQHGPVLLQAGGAVVAASADTRTSVRTGAGVATNSVGLGLGRWRVADGVLQLALADGTRYALTLRDNPHALAGVGRRASDQAPEDEGVDVQWPAHMHRHGVAEPAADPVQQVLRKGNTSV